MTRHFGAGAERASPGFGAVAPSVDSTSAADGASRNRGAARLTRRLFISAATGLLPALAYAQGGSKPSAKSRAPDEFSGGAPVAIEVHARPIPSFDARDRSRARFGALQYRSGLVSTSPFRGFGGLSG